MHFKEIIQAVLQRTDLKSLGQAAQKPAGGGGMEVGSSDPIRGFSPPLPAESNGSGISRLPHRATVNLGARERYHKKSPGGRRGGNLLWGRPHPSALPAAADSRPLGNASDKGSPG